MQIYCEKCRAPQRGAEKTCLKCGAPFGGDRWVIVVAVFLLLGLPGAVAMGGRAGDVAELVGSPIIYVGFVLPILIATAVLYDHNPVRLNVYFFGGALLIALGVYLFF